MTLQAFNLNNLRGIWRENYNLISHNSWHLNAVAHYFYQPADLADLQQLLKTMPQDLSIFWLGAGTNVLIRDSAIDGLVICLRGCLDAVREMDDDGTIEVQAGAPCARLLRIGIKEGMLDMAFLAGIPGTVGGALAMNAGAYGDTIWQHVSNVTTINRHGELKERKPDEFQIGYRQVIGLDVHEWFVSCYLKFKKQDVQLTKERVHELLLKRRATQPSERFNCGSVFRNPPNDYAARLIEVCGLKGKRIGGAYVSPKHANFIINDGTATAQDIENLMEYVTDVVYKQCNVKLEREVRIFINK